MTTNHTPGTHTVPKPRSSSTGVPDPRRLRRAGAALVVAAVAFVGTLQPATASVGAAQPSPTPSSSSSGGPDKPFDARQRATFGVRGVTDGKVDDRAYLTYGATTGGRLTDHIAIANVSLRPLTLQVYATDAINDATGDLTLLPETRRPTAAGSWISIGTPGASGSVRVAPRSFAIIPLHVRIPANASPGDHVAGVVASLATVSKRHGVNVRLHQRVGMRVFVRISGALRPGLAVEAIGAQYDGTLNPVGKGSATVTYRVHNIGNVNLGAEQVVSVHGLFGQTATVHPERIPLLLPGSSIDVRTEVPGVAPELWLRSTVSLKPLILQGSYVPHLEPAYSANTHFWAVPWVLIAVVIAVLAAGWWWRRRRRARRDGGGGRHRSGSTGAQQRLDSMRQESVT